MNILYIGPYRQVDYIGQVSSVHIDSIRRSMSVSDKLLIKPLYIDTSLSNDDTYYDNEINDLTHIDTLIQHVPVGFVSIQKHFKNIVIPIMDPKLQNISQDYNYNILTHADKILVDEEKNKNLLRMNGITTDIELYEEKIDINNFQQFNLDESEQSYRFGFIGQYQPNKLIINKIIHSFLLAYRSQHNVKLYLFLRGSDKDKEELKNTVNSIKKQLYISDYIYSIHHIFGLWNQSEALTALNSINCFISLNDDYRYLLYEKFFTSSESEMKNKFLINRQNVQSVEVPTATLSNRYEYKNTICSINTIDLTKKMSNAVTSSYQKNKPSRHKSLGSIICK